MLVSICIPTCDRPELLELALASCLAQTHAPIQIVVGDDSRNDATQTMMRTRYGNDSRIHYVRNTPPLGQGLNVASLFTRAEGDKILLLHDDDLLEHDAIESLLGLWQRHPDLEIAFGDQYVIDIHGAVDLEQSRAGNIAFYRTKAAEGLQKAPGRTGLVSMFPNNGWLANADLVKRVNYKAQFGSGCDFAFGVEVCLAASKIYYLKRYVSSYRVTPGAISQTTGASMNSAAVEAYRIVHGLRLARELEPARRVAYKRMVPIVVSTLSRHDEPVKSLKLALMHLHAYNYGLSPRFYYHMLLIGKSMLHRKRGRLANT
ncbi:glycosyltransferase [Pararobbsia silviterrae]|uniref:Glycosyltransferase n=1 Tax=Pararobbsia silviterrae TaxID=1792498 RepID=A0A494Y8D7_9BURK|nr:glycosyltransferase [Pararobbsia silviterrae]